MGRTISIYYALIDGGIAAGIWLWGTVAQNHSLNLPLELCCWSQQQASCFLSASAACPSPIL